MVSFLNFNAQNLLDMKKLALFIVGIIVTISGFSQTASWVKAVGTAASNTGDRINEVAVDASGNVYVVGQIDNGSVTIGSDVMDNSGNSGSNGFLAKYNSSGVAQWGVFLECLDGGNASAVELEIGLQQDGKIIGVISHVSALKERISTQIQVTPQTGGRSQISGLGCRTF